MKDVCDGKKGIEREKKTGTLAHVHIRRMTQLIRINYIASQSNRVHIFESEFLLQLNQRSIENRLIKAFTRCSQTTNR